MEIYMKNLNSYELATGKSLAMFLFKENNKIFLLRGTVVSPYMAEKLSDDIMEALKIGFSLLDIADLYNDKKSVSLYCTTMDTFKKFCNDKWNWYKWSMTSHFRLRFWKYISHDVKIIEV